MDKQEILNKIGVNLAKLRLEYEKSPKELASLLEISTQAYGNIERGKSELSITKIFKIATFYNLSINQIIGVSNDNSNTFISHGSNSLVGIQNGNIHMCPSDKIIEIDNKLNILLSKY